MGSSGLRMEAWSRALVHKQLKRQPNRRAKRTSMWTHSEHIPAIARSPNAPATIFRNSPARDKRIHPTNPKAKHRECQNHNPSRYPEHPGIHRPTSRTRIRTPGITPEAIGRSDIFEDARTKITKAFHGDTRQAALRIWQDALQEALQSCRYG